MTGPVPTISSHATLLASAKHYFAEHHEATKMEIGTAIDDKLGWQPSLHFEANDHLIIAAEMSDTPYPAILRLRHADLMNIDLPIAVYCVCPEEAFLSKEAQPDVRLLQAHGYGLITVDRNQHPTRRFSCIPLIQHIPDDEFKNELDGLPKRLRARIRDAFDKYHNNAVSGLQDLSEAIEGLIHSAAKGAVRKGWAPKGLLGKTTAEILDDFAALRECKAARAAIGAMRGFVKQYRNPSHHYPKSKKEALKKYRSAQHGFKDGLKQIPVFRRAMAGIGIPVSL
jgi:hypothetical protein